MNSIIALLAGMLAGAVFYGGLWFTVQRLVSSAHPVRLMLVSAGLRFAAVLAVFYWVARIAPVSLIPVVAGLILVKVILSRTIGQSKLPVSNLSTPS